MKYRPRGAGVRGEIFIAEDATCLPETGLSSIASSADVFDTLVSSSQKATTEMHVESKSFFVGGEEDDLVIDEAFVKSVQEEAGTFGDSSRGE